MRHTARPLSALFSFRSRDHFNPQVEGFADFGYSVKRDVHAPVFDTVEMADINAAAVDEVANRQPCGVTSLRNSQAYSLASDATDGGRPSQVNTCVNFLFLGSK